MAEVLYPVECPTCLASPGNRCRSIKTRRITDYHEARRRKWYARDQRPSTAELVGIAEDWLGGQSVDDYISEIRDDAPEA